MWLSTITILTANGFAVYYLITGQWNGMALFIVFWIESLIIGVSTIVKMKKSKKAYLLPNKSPMAAGSQESKEGINAFALIYFGWLLICLLFLSVSFIAMVVNKRESPVIFSVTVTILPPLISTFMGEAYGLYTFSKYHLEEKVAPAEIQGWVFVRVLIIGMSLFSCFLIFGIEGTKHVFLTLTLLKCGWTILETATKSKSENRKHYY